METIIKELLPLQFKDLKEISKTKITKVKKPFKVNIDFYSSNNVVPNNFHKPISKIIKFEF